MDGKRERERGKRANFAFFVPLFCSRLAGKPVRELEQQRPFRASVSLCRLIQLTKVCPIPRGIQNKRTPFLVLTPHSTFLDCFGRSLPAFWLVSIISGLSPWLLTHSLLLQPWRLSVLSSENSCFLFSSQRYSQGLVPVLSRGAPKVLSLCSPSCLSVL